MAGALDGVQAIEDMVFQLFPVDFSLFQDFIAFQHHARRVLVLLLALVFLFGWLVGFV